MALTIVSTNINKERKFALEFVKKYFTGVDSVCLCFFIEFPMSELYEFQQETSIYNCIIERCGRFLIVYSNIHILTKCVVEYPVQEPRAMFCEFKDHQKLERYRIAVVHGLDLMSYPANSPERTGHDYVMFKAIRSHIFDGPAKEFVPAFIVGDFNMFPFSDSMFKDWGLKSSSDTYEIGDRASVHLYNHSLEMVHNLNNQINSNSTKHIWGTYRFVSKNERYRSFTSYELIDNVFFSPMSMRMLQSGKIESRYLIELNGMPIISRDDMVIEKFDHLPIELCIL